MRDGGQKTKPREHSAPGGGGFSRAGGRDACTDHHPHTHFLLPTEIQPLDQHLAVAS